MKLGVISIFIAPTSSHVLTFVLARSMALLALHGRISAPRCLVDAWIPRKQTTHGRAQGHVLDGRPTARGASTGCSRNSAHGPVGDFHTANRDGTDLVPGHRRGTHRGVRDPGVLTPSMHRETPDVALPGPRDLSSQETCEGFEHGAFGAHVLHEEPPRAEEVRRTHPFDVGDPAVPGRNSVSVVTDQTHLVLEGGLVRVLVCRHLPVVHLQHRARHGEERPGLLFPTTMVNPMSFSASTKEG